MSSRFHRSLTRAHHHGALKEAKTSGRLVARRLAIKQLETKARWGKAGYWLLMKAKALRMYFPGGKSEAASILRSL